MVEVYHKDYSRFSLRSLLRAPHSVSYPSASLSPLLEFSLWHALSDTRDTCTPPGLMQACASIAIINMQTVHKCASPWGPRSQPPLLQPSNACMERLRYLWPCCCPASLCLSCPLLRDAVGPLWRRLFAKAVNKLDAAGRSQDPEERQSVKAGKKRRASDQTRWCVAAKV